MSNYIVDTIAAALNGRPHDFRLGADLRKPAADVLAALRADHRVAVLDLPEEMTEEEVHADGFVYHPDQPGWEAGGAWAAVSGSGDIYVEGAGQRSRYGDIYSPAAARDLARVLLAAADKLERPEQ